MKSKPKICFVVPEFYPDIGGIATATMDFSLELIKRKYPVFVIAMTKNRKYKKYEIYKGIKIYRIFCKNIKGIGGSQFFFIKKAPKFIKKINPDVVYAQTIFPSGVISAQFKDKLTICHGRGTDVTYSLGMKRYYIFNRYALRNNKYIFAKNKYDAKKIKDFYKRKVIVFPTGINIPDIKGSKRYWKKRLHLDEKKFHVLYVGRGTSFKGINYLKQAIRGLKDCELHLIGVDEQISRKDVFKFMKACDVFVYPEIVGQGLSNAVLEAMALRMPVIGMNVGFFKELIRNGENGILVKPRSSLEIKKAIIKLKNNKKLRNKISRNAYLTIIKKYNFKIMYDKFKEILMRNGVNFG